jgi:sugar phosphate isomerase/epimerase
MREAVKLADRHEVTLAFEPELNNVVNSVAKARRLLDEIDSPWLKVVIDPVNLIRPGELPRVTEILDEAFDWLGSDIVLAHAKNPRDDESPGRNLALGERVDSADFWQLLRELAADVLRGKMTIGVSETQHGGLYEIFSFYYNYFTWLNTIQYGGTIVIHGLPESEVGPMSDLLTRLLLCLDRSP